MGRKRGRQQGGPAAAAAVAGRPVKGSKAARRSAAHAFVQQARQHQVTEAQQERKRRRVEEKKKRRGGASNAMVPYRPEHSILLVGEGNFSFAASLVTLLGSGGRVVATCFDSEKVVGAKYADAHQHIDTVLGSGGSVEYGIDATRLTAYKQLNGPFDSVVFNFPHSGSGIKDVERNILKNQQLLTKFFASAVQLVHDTGEIHVTIKAGEPYASWKVVRLGLDQPSLRLKNAFAFDPRLYPGYEHRRTLGHQAGLSSSDNKDIEKGAKTYVFARQPAAEDDGGDGKG